MTPRTIIACRHLLGWEQVDLAEHAGVARGTVQAAEAGGRPVHRNTLAKIRAAFEAAGIITAEGGGLRQITQRLDVPPHPKGEYISKTPPLGRYGRRFRL